MKRSSGCWAIVAAGAVVLSAAFAESAAAAAPCSKRAARDAIAASPAAKRAIRRTGNVVPGRDVLDVYGVARVRCRDLAGDRRRELGVLVRCCTVSSYSPFLIFRRSGSGWELAFSRSRMTIFKVSSRGRSYVLKEPRYKPTDRNCCPSGYRYFRIRWAQGRFRMKRIRD
jgi:hypothetical protein